VELREADVAAWVEADGEFVVGALGPEGPARIARESRVYLPRLTERGDRLLDNIVKALLA
jgi:hypothetical protein